jgi:hypothetical protein
VVLRLRGSELSSPKVGSNYVVTPPNRDLSEPLGRSGTLVHITLAPMMRQVAPSGPFEVFLAVKEVSFKG